MFKLLAKSTGWTTHAIGYSTALTGGLALLGVAGLDAMIPPDKALLMIANGLGLSRLRAAIKK